MYEQQQLQTDMNSLMLLNWKPTTKAVYKIESYLLNSLSKIENAWRTLNTFSGCVSHLFLLKTHTRSVVGPLRQRYNGKFQLTLLSTKCSHHKYLPAHVRSKYFAVCSIAKTLSTSCSHRMRSQRYQLSGVWEGCVLGGLFSLGLGWEPLWPDISWRQCTHTRTHMDTLHIATFSWQLVSALSSWQLSSNRATAPATGCQEAQSDFMFYERWHVATTVTATAKHLPHGTHPHTQTHTQTKRRALVTFIVRCLVPSVCKCVRVCACLRACSCGCRCNML